MKTAPPRPTRPTFRALALSLALALTLVACGRTIEETDPTPPPEEAQPAAALRPMPEVWTTRALIADGPPTVTGGSFENSVYTNHQTYEGCLSPEQPHCVSYTSYLPTPPPGMWLQVAPVLPVLALTGQPVSFSPPGQPPCMEPLLAEVLYGTDAWPWPRSLPAGPVLIERSATRLMVSLCVRGEIRVQLGDLTGTLSFARWQPLHR